MRNFLIALILAFLASCSPKQVRWGGLEQDDIRESVYKVKVTLTLDTSSLNKKEESTAPEKKKEHMVTFYDRDVQVISETSDTIEVGWSGTGWVGARSVGKSYVMTAGHVCESGSVFETQYLDWSKFQVVTLELPIIKVEHTLISRDGTEFTGAKVLRDEDLDDEFNGNDLCMLQVAGNLGSPIPVASEDPPYGGIAEVVGAPRGLWGGGIAVASDVKYSGRGSVFDVSPDGLAFNGPVAAGNSGSAVTYQGWVVGVVSLGATRFPSLIHAVPHERIREFMRKALHL